ncbi:DNA replication/repair protein RecF [Luteimonas sp. RD2P54]|uniref:DNA replication and repair protein RecF n=1 Tax=Luteimonas endophytica TaxID=3042023 RepID=A0ABT6J8S8_9GAMM|nr:DNA replication/repair protein RecF [Luteimonas endophytica]MDH5822608.1 DNA replication/repair protein RecF [Luteimonas endophytica]
MRVTRLHVRNLRRLESIELEPGPGLNFLIGDNGAGKTSVLEALHLMAYGRSFRGRVRDGLVRSGCPALEVFVEWIERQCGQPRRAGLRHAGGDWSGRLDGEAVAQLGDLCAALAVVSFEPGSHALISGGGEPRRRFVDWGLFHVEQDFLAVWRRYARALRQRNALLKSLAPTDQLEAWDRELALAGEPLTAARQRYLERLEPLLREAVAGLAPMLGTATLQLQPGWRRDELPLEDALLLARDRDRALGHTSVGPHRADWRLGFSSAPNREPLSRGQTKLAALACLVAQARDYAACRGEWPVMVLDDLASELDRTHRQRVLATLREGGAQVFVSGTDWPDTQLPGLGQANLFHVEQGRVAPA